MINNNYLTTDIYSHFNPIEVAPSTGTSSDATVEERTARLYEDVTTNAFQEDLDWEDPNVVDAWAAAVNPHQNNPNPPSTERQSPLTYAQNAQDDLNHPSTEKKVTLTSKQKEIEKKILDRSAQELIQSRIDAAWEGFHRIKARTVPSIYEAYKEECILNQIPPKLDGSFKHSLRKEAKNFHENPPRNERQEQAFNHAVDSYLKEKKRAGGCKLLPGKFIKISNQYNKDLGINHANDSDRNKAYNQLYNQIINKFNCRDYAQKQSASTSPQLTNPQNVFVGAYNDTGSNSNTAESLSGQKRAHAAVDDNELDVESLSGQKRAHAAVDDNELDFDFLLETVDLTEL